MRKGTSSRLREQSVLRLLALGRRLFANTRLNRWRISSAAKRYLMLFAFGHAERTVDFHGAKLIVQLDEVASTPAILAGSYEALSLTVFKLLASRAKVVLDIGGGQGMYAVVAGRAMAEGGTVLCFEPVPENQKLIQRNITLNGLEDTVVVRDQALSDSPCNDVLGARKQGRTLVIVGRDEVSLFNPSTSRDSGSGPLGETTLNC